MSGYKRATVTIGEDEYDRLREAEKKLRSLPLVSDEEYRAISQKSEKAIQANFSKIAQRQASFENLLNGMSQMVQGLESTTSQAIASYQASAAAQIQQYAGFLWDNFNQAIASNAEFFANSLAATQQELQAELDNYSSQVRRLSNDQASKQALAQDWLDAAGQLGEFIQMNYDHEHFTPGQVAYLERELDQACDNMELGLSEGVIITAQQLYRSFSDLRIALERAETEWHLIIQSALETASQIYVQAQESQVVPAVDLDGNLLSYTIDVDYWTGGRLSQLIADLQGIQDQLADEQNLPDSATLRDWLENDLPVYYQALEATILDARITALNSQLRINIADLVVHSLQEQGFALAACDYEAGDMRMAYDARMVNLEGNQVMVQVAPTGRELGENELHLQSLDREQRTEHELQRRWYEVSRALSSCGLAVGSYIREDTASYSVEPQNPSRRPGPLLPQQNPARKRGRTNDQPSG